MVASRLLGLILSSVVAVILAVSCTRDEGEQMTQPPPNEDFAAACFSCHSDSVTTLVSAGEQWMRSQHASGDNIDRDNTPCMNCHTHEGFVQLVDGIPTTNPVGNPTSIHCFTCHAPHTKGNLDLRITEIVPIQDGSSADLGGANICAQCHQSRRDVNSYVTEPAMLSRFWGPHHGVETDMLIAGNGYEYAGFMYEDNAAHRTLTEDGCLDCHMKTTSNFVLGGHSFNMEWDDGGSSVENTDACEPCHSLDDFDYNGVQTTVDSLLTELDTALQMAGLIDSDHHPMSVTTSRDSAGAVWNYLLVYEDGSDGVHNGPYAVSLLQSSLQHLGVAPAADGTGFLCGPRESLERRRLSAETENLSVTTPPWYELPTQPRRRFRGYRCRAQPSLRRGSLSMFPSIPPIRGPSWA